MSAETGALTGRLQQMIEPVVLDYGLDLVELQFRREDAGWVLRLIVDGEQGVGIDDCACISREVSHLLEVEDPIERSYQLEVSSPGLDRPLKRERDYIRCRGKLAKIVCREPVEGELVFQGRLGELHDGVIDLELEAEEGEGDPGVVSIPLYTVKRAKLIVEWAL